MKERDENERNELGKVNQKKKKKRYVSVWIRKS